MSAAIDWFPNTCSQVCAVVLAASRGARLFPMTSSETPKHLLPVAGIPSILRLLDILSNVPEVVVAIASDDTKTLSVIQQIATLQQKQTTQPKQQQTTGEHTTASQTQQSSSSTNAATATNIWSLSSKKGNQHITLVQLGDDSFGSVDALRQLEESNVIDTSCHVVVLPGDLVCIKHDIDLDALFRPSSKEAACTVLLVDVGEQDEHGIPIKESSKAKKGGLARDEEDIEYIALSFPTSSNNVSSHVPRVVWKQSKLDVESDEDMTGTSCKLCLPKPRLRHGRVCVRTDWSDVHVYAFAPWVRRLLVERKSLVSIQGDLLPLLISRQFKGKKATFGNKKDKKDESAEDAGDGGSTTNLTATNEPETNNDDQDDTLYSVLAHVVPNKTALRVNTIPAYLFACREIVANGAKSPPLPKDSKWNGKFQTLVLEATTSTKLGPKINMKSTVIGKSCQLGAKCRLNNVVVMDSVTLGENCSLQNTVIGPGASLGNNCSLNDCQVGPGKEISTGTKAKGESFMVGDDAEEAIL